MFTEVWKRGGRWGFVVPTGLRVGFESVVAARVESKAWTALASGRSSPFHFPPAQGGQCSVPAAFSSPANSSPDLYGDIRTKITSLYTSKYTF